MKVLPLLRFPFISLGTKKTLTGNLMKPALSYSSVAEDKKHVRLVTALKSRRPEPMPGPASFRATPVQKIVHFLRSERVCPASRIGSLPRLPLNGRNRNLDECQLLGKERTSKLHNV